MHLGCIFPQRNNYERIKNRLKEEFKGDNSKDFVEFLKEKVIFTYAKTNDLDTAFILFDSQNTRGKPLKRKDLLKVHHIRFIEDEKYALRKIVAKEWELMSKSESEQKDELDILLELLAIARKGIRGELEGNDLVEVDVYREFRAEGDSYKLNNYSQPPIFEDFSYDLSKNELFLKLKAIRGLYCWMTEGWKYIPFQIPQSIEGGENFFYFVYKYYKLLEDLEKFEDGKIFSAIDRASGAGNMFLRKVYKSLLLLFADKFGTENLKEFAVRVLTLLFYFRIASNSIRREGVIRFEWNKGEKLDLYKLIFLKYCPKIVNKNIDRYVLYSLSDEVIRNKVGKKENNGNICFNSNVKNTFLNRIDYSLQDEMKKYLKEKKKYEILKLLFGGDGGAVKNS